MPVQIIRNDITKMKVDAIVNAAKESLLGGGGVDGAIHEAAGPELLKECKTLGGCKTGDAKLTKAYNLPCRYVIHTVGPVWRGGNNGECKLLISCYQISLALAKAMHFDTVAFPVISSGNYGYPKAEAFRVAIDTISKFLIENDVDMTVYIVIFDKTANTISKELFTDIEAYINKKQICDRPEYVRSFNVVQAKATESALSVARAGTIKAASLDDAMKRLDESFSEMLLRKIDEKGMTDVQCYKKANIDRKLFSKIRADKNYKPSKITVIAFAIALELSLEDTRNMLMKAGFALSHSNKFDIIIEFFIEHGNYNVFEINEALFAFDQSLLGA